MIFVTRRMKSCIPDAIRVISKRSQRSLLLETVKRNQVIHKRSQNSPTLNANRRSMIKFPFNGNVDHLRGTKTLFRKIYGCMVVAFHRFLIDGTFNPSIKEPRM